MTTHYKKKIKVSIAWIVSFKGKKCHYSFCVV
jgi:hypothetical protein